MCLQFIALVVVTLVGNFIVGIALSEHKNRVREISLTDSY